MYMSRTQPHIAGDPGSSSDAVDGQHFDFLDKLSPQECADEYDILRFKTEIQGLCDYAGDALCDEMWQKHIT